MFYSIALFSFFLAMCIQFHRDRRRQERDAAIIDELRAEAIALGIQNEKLRLQLMRLTEPYRAVTPSPSDPAFREGFSLGAIPLEKQKWFPNKE